MCRRTFAQMVAGNRIAPETVFEPERSVNDRIVLLGCAHVEPDAPETVDGLQFRLGNVQVVVEQPPAAGRREIGRRDRDQEQPGQQQVSPEVPLRRSIGGPGRWLHTPLTTAIRAARRKPYKHPAGSGLRRRNGGFPNQRTWDETADSRVIRDGRSPGAAAVRTIRPGAASVRMTTSARPWKSEWGLVR